MKRAIEFSFTTDGGPLRDLRLVSVKRRCELCGDYKDDAFDVCWDPGVRCKREAPDAPDSP